MEIKTSIKMRLTSNCYCLLGAFHCRIQQPSLQHTQIVQDKGFAILIFASAIGSLIKCMPPLTHIFKKKKKPRMIMDPGSGMGGGSQAKQDLQ